MAIRRIRVAFDIDVNVLAAALATHNCGMHIQLAGDAIEGPIPDDEEPEATKHLAAPKHGGIQTRLLQYYRDNDEVISTARLKLVFKQYTAKQIWQAIARMTNQGLIRRTRRANYRITPRGKNHA